MKRSIRGQSDEFPFISATTDDKTTISNCGVKSFRNADHDCVS